MGVSDKVMAKEDFQSKKRKLSEDTKGSLQKVANTIRHLSIDGVQKANSGHPGLPLGCADIAAYLFGLQLKHNPKNSKWLNRDRFILSAGHGCMLLYSSLCLSGFDLSVEDLKNFRQLHSKTPGHPESFETDGVETTTGPLGQGVGNAVGQALGLKCLGSCFNTKEQEIFNSKVYVLAGDGCIMEGISSEVSSLAGHLKLNNLVLIYDANNITLDGPLSESCSEDVKMRYKAYGWDVFEVDGHDFDAMHDTFNTINEGQERPCLIIARTVIGKGSPNKAGTHKVHGAPLGAEEVLATKKALDLSEEDFHVPQAVKKFFDLKLKKDADQEKVWKENFELWRKKNPELNAEFAFMANRELPENLESQLKDIEIASPIAGRKASVTVIQTLADLLPHLYGGSADLSCSDLTKIENYSSIFPGNFSGRNVKFGVREFGMAAMAIGMAQTTMITPFIGTFLTFSDYMRNAIRLSALSKVPVIYQFTHDSILLGEDGPTHQPVEHFASLRTIPNLHVIRPCDSNEVKMAWLSALRYQGPTVLIFTRQNLPIIPGTEVPFNEGLERGAYIIRKEKGAADYTLVATGSEVALASDVADELEKRGKNVRVVSMPSWELFENQSNEYQSSIFGKNCGHKVSIEVGVDHGWHKYIGSEGTAICMESFGASAPASALAKEFGFTVDSILERIL